MPEPFPRPKVGLVTLGCDKNTVDSERYLSELLRCGAERSRHAADADILIVNTCGFIDAAKAESIDAILEAARYKREGACRALVAIGCMVERHRTELQQALPEVDVFLGTSDADRLVGALADRGLIDGAARAHPGVRAFAGGRPHVRYLKISEGCDHGCAFCAIPLMRGRHRSFALGDVVREAQLLELQGAREINLVAQDLAHYGRDRRDGTDLPVLLDALLAETSVPWYRLLYIYSAGLTRAVLERVAGEPRLVPYIDMPMQHASDPVLQRMRRPEREATLRARIAQVRDVVPDVAIRTTCIVGFPGETEADFERLLAFLEDVRLERVGAFAYSAQEGTRAATLEDDVPEAVKRERLERLTALQRVISAECYETRVGRVVPAIIDEVRGPRVLGRTLWQADDVDGVVRVTTSDGGTAVRRTLAPGALVTVRLDAVTDAYDFEASLVDITRSAPPRRAEGRLLPVLAGAAGASFGR